jgi:hypothetical protein
MVPSDAYLNRCTTSFEARGEEMMLDGVDYHIEHRQEIRKHVKTTSRHTSSWQQITIGE